MEDRKEIGISSNLYKTFNMQSKLGISGIDKIMKNALVAENIGLKYDRIFNTRIDKAIKSAMMVENIGKRYTGIFNSGISDIIRNASTIPDISKSIGMAGSFHNNYYDKFIRQHSKNLGSIKMDYMSGVGKMSGALGAIQNSPILELSSSMKAWQASVKVMSNDFSNSYNSIITESIKSLSAGIIEMKRNMVDSSSIKSFNINEWIPELSNVGTLEFTEELEKEIDLQEVKAIINSKIEDINLTIREQSNTIIFAINKLREAVIENNTKGGMISEVVKGVLITIISAFIMFVFTSLNPYTPSNADIKYTVKVTKQIVRAMEVDSSFYNENRIVVKDELEVRRSSKMKSKVKYYLDFGDLVKIEHKNRNWTKISYVNTFTDEREVGWVLTRYIKRLD